MRRSNCLFWALWRWLRRGGYVAIAWNRQHPYSHWFHADTLDGPWLNYYPVKKPAFVPLFRGYVKEGEK